MENDTHVGILLYFLFLNKQQFLWLKFKMPIKILEGAKFRFLIAYSAVGCIQLRYTPLSSLFRIEFDICGNGDSVYSVLPEHILSLCAPCYCMHKHTLTRFDALSISSWEIAKDFQTSSKFLNQKSASSLSKKSVFKFFLIRFAKKEITVYIFVRSFFYKKKRDQTESISTLFVLSHYRLDSKHFRKSV